MSTLFEIARPPVTPRDCPQPEADLGHLDPGAGPEQVAGNGVVPGAHQVGTPGRIAGARIRKVAAPEAAGTGLRAAAIADEAKREKIA
jgi:hypothetical protein